jgi:hypothetical protein
MYALRWLAFGGGVLLIGWTAMSLIRTLVVPRGHISGLSQVSERATRCVFFFLSDRIDEYKRKDRLLALLGPATLLAQLLTWVVMFLLGFALLLLPFGAPSFASAARASGSAMFTLGIVQPHGPATVVHFAAAATGLFVVALQISYLPTLYAAFNRREVLVTTLATRAGSPAWGPEILARHYLVRTLDAMPAFYGDWERWAADVGESHSNYPVLVDFRSPHPLRNWVLGLLAVMDSAALYLALSPSAAPSEARLMMRMGFTALRDIARALRIPFDPDPLPEDPVALTYEEFEVAVARLRSAGFPIERAPQEAWPHFRGWRVNYEQLAYAFADRVVAAPALWSGPRTHVPGGPISLQRPVDRRPDNPGERPEADTTEWRV